MDKNMKQYLDKAEVLIEALPYIQKFNRTPDFISFSGEPPHRQGFLLQQTHSENQYLPS